MTETFMEQNEEVNEINQDDLEAASKMFQELIDNTFYQNQENSGFKIKFIS